MRQVIKHVVHERCVHASHNLTFRINFGCHLGDYLAHTEVCCLKGPSGINMCTLCRNMTIKTDTLPNGIFKYYGTATPKDFLPHSRDTMKTVLQKLKSLADLKDDAPNPGAKNRAAAELALHEKIFGIKYTSESLMFSEDTAFSLPDNMYIDWPHTLVMSGSLGQIEVQLFCSHVRKHGTLEQISQWIFHVSFWMPTSMSVPGRTAS